MVVTRCGQLTQFSASVSAWTRAANSHAKTPAAVPQLLQLT
jgi:hypothetical protein